jgi:hypothetical protein
MPTEPTKMHALFAAAKSELLAMDESKLQRPRVFGERATQLTAALVKEVQPLVARFAEELAPARVAQRSADLAAVTPNAQIFYAADLAVEDPWTSEQKARRDELVKKVREHDETLSAWAVPLFKNDPKARDIVASIVRGRGIRDDANDTVRWVSLFKDRWSEVEGKTPVTLATLDVAEAEATELLAILDASGDESKGSPRDLRRRAFTRWANGYNELADVARYLLRADPEAVARIPAIAAERGASEPTPDAPPSPTPA